MTKQMNCLVCDTEFTAMRKSAKFCSPKCRVAASRMEPGKAYQIPGDIEKLSQAEEKIAYAIIDTLYDSFKKTGKIFDTSPCTKHKGFKGTCGCK